MELRGVTGGPSTFNFRGRVLSQLVLHGDASMVRGHSQFADDDETDPQTGANIGGQGCLAIFEEDGARIEIFGSVRALAPILREAADAFERRLSELPA
jgi:hypothetical protein